MSIWCLGYEYLELYFHAFMCHNIIVVNEAQGQLAVTYAWRLQKSWIWLFYFSFWNWIIADLSYRNIHRTLEFLRFVSQWEVNNYPCQ